MAKIITVQGIGAFGPYSDQDAEKVADYLFDLRMAVRPEVLDLNDLATDDRIKDEGKEDFVKSLGKTPVAVGSVLYQVVSSNERELPSLLMLNESLLAMRPWPAYFIEETFVEAPANKCYVYQILDVEIDIATMVFRDAVGDAVKDVFQFERLMFGGHVDQ